MGWSALLALLAPAVPGLINTAEAIFTAPKSGETRGSAVLGGLKSIIQGLVATGHPAVSPPPGNPAGALPSDDILKGLIEAVFQGMKNGGTLAPKVPSVAPTVPATTGEVFLLRGVIAKVPEFA